MRKLYSWCMLKARCVIGAIVGLLPKREYLLKVRKKIWRVALVLGMLLLMCPVLFSHSMYATGFSSSDFTYTGAYTWVDDGGGSWRLKFLTSGTFTPSKAVVIDVFIVGGGGGGGGTTDNDYTSGGGGGGGYTGTWANITLYANQAYPIVIGAGGAGASAKSVAASTGGTTSGFGYSKTGGIGAAITGANGGSGGGSSGYSSSYNAGDGGTDGGNGGSSNARLGGTGQGSTTKEFGEATGYVYSGGGGGGRHGTGGSNGVGGVNGGGDGGANMNGTANTGGGGGGAIGTYDGNRTGGSGGSGILIIRNKR